MRYDRGGVTTTTKRTRSLIAKGPASFNAAYGMKTITIEKNESAKRSSEKKLNSQASDARFTYWDSGSYSVFTCRLLNASIPKDHDLAPVSFSTVSDLSSCLTRNQLCKHTRGHLCQHTQHVVNFSCTGLFYRPCCVHDEDAHHLTFSYC